jgi:hypothetical protein
MLLVTGRSGHVLDDVTLADGVLTYTTGAARPFVEGPRGVKPALSDAELYALAADTSNGYVTITTSGGDQ